MPDNRAAWLVVKDKPLEVKSAPYPTPGPHEIVVRNRAVAINPVDWMLAKHGTMIFSWLKFPLILGSDIAGEVVQVGSEVKRFKAGDRVVAVALGIEKTKLNTREGAFQDYVIAREPSTSPIPDSVSYEQASVLPLGVCTAASSLYMKDYLALQHPSTSAKSTGKTVLIWGGSTSVGCCAIQLAVASGYEVITTCSPRNFDYVKKLGASHAFDYNSPTVVQDIVAVFSGKESAGALAIGSGGAEKCLDVIAKTKGSKMVAMASYAVQPSDLPSNIFGMVPLLFALGRANLSIAWKCRTKGLKTNFIWGGDLVYNEVGPAVFVDFLGDALRQKKFVPAPEPLVVGKGLDKIQEAFGVQRKGVSAKKVVVSL
jgi:NADPH:quinone reductase-like Zn-dependent oxidoreductase